MSEKLQKANTLQARIDRNKRELDLCEKLLDNHAGKGKAIRIIVPTIPDQTSNCIIMEPALMAVSSDVIVDGYMNNLRALIEREENELKELFK